MNPPLVVVDIGNTRVQIGIVGRVRHDGLPEWQRIESARTDSWDPSTLAVILPAGPAAWRVASVNRPAEHTLVQWRRQARPHDDYRQLTVRNLPLRVDVDYPERVGMDRLAAAVAANRLRPPAHGAIVVDAGTAVTVDAVSRDGAFRGGVILPGLRMVTRALASETDLLPMVEVAFSDEPPPVLGKSTEAAIRSGAFWGAVGAIRQVISCFPRDLGADTQLYVTGGDARILATLIDPRAVYVPNMVLAGIVWSEL